MEWGFIWLMFVLKIPLIALLWLVWYAIKAAPEPEPEPDSARAAATTGVTRAARCTAGLPAAGRTRSHRHLPRPASAWSAGGRSTRATAEVTGAADDEGAADPLHGRGARARPSIGSDGVRSEPWNGCLDNAREHIFDGIIIRASDGSLRFVDAPEVARTAERAVTPDDRLCRGGGAARAQLRCEGLLSRLGNAFRGR